ncbi:MAG: FixH family protein [Gammaproteobacteria bacterium]|nr:FixH family protein [Gammaproteobacteria bacterium]
MTHTATAGDPLNSRRFNPTLWAMIGIPSAAVLASLMTLFLAIDGAEAELPGTYATEGQRLDEDFRLRAAARQAGVAVALRVDRAGIVEAQLQRADSGSAPEHLRVELTHVTDVRRDRQLDLQRIGISNRYRGEMSPVPNGRWLVRISEPGRWHVVGHSTLPANRVDLGRSP